MRVILHFALMLFCFHPELAECQSQKSQNWRIPVLPDFDAEAVRQNESQKLEFSQNRSRRFERLTDPMQGHLSSPADRVVNQNQLEQTKTTPEMLQSLGVVSTGAESGRWGGGRLSLRGHPGAEPAVSLQGVLLSSGFSGAHGEELLPQPAIDRVRVYPFFPTLGLPRVGLAGGYDFELVAGPQPEAKSVYLFSEWPAAGGMAGRQQINCSLESCLQLSWSGGFYRGRQRILDDRNTPQVESDDGVETLRLKDVQRISSAGHYRFGWGTGSRLDTTVLLGGESRSTSGLPLVSASEKNRLTRKIAFVSQEFFHNSPLTGVLASVRVSGRREGALFNQDLKNSAQQIRSDNRTESFLSTNGYISLPLADAGAHERLFLFSSAEQNFFSSQTSLSEPPSVVQSNAKTSLDGRLWKGDVGAGVNFAAGSFGIFKFESSIQWNKFSLNRTCGVFSPQVLCSESESTAGHHGLGAVGDWRKIWNDSWLLFVQAGQLSRPPGPVEIAGRPDGILANTALLPESTLAVEWGFQNRFAGMSFYLAQDKNLISAEQASPYLLQYKNSSAVRRSGVLADGEILLFGYRIAGEVEKTFATIQKATSGNRVLPFVPEHRIKVSCEKSTTPMALNERSQIQLRSAIDVQQSGPYWLDFQGVSRLQPPLIANLRFVIPLTTGQETVETSLITHNVLNNNTSGLNLLGQSTRRVPWSDSPAIPIQGRSFEVNLRLLTR